MPGRSGAGETITTVGFDDAAVGAECTDPLEERGGADANLGSQFGERNRLVGTGEDGRDALVERTGRRRHRLAATSRGSSGEGMSKRNAPQAEPSINVALAPKST